MMQCFCSERNVFDLHSRSFRKSTHLLPILRFTDFQNFAKLFGFSSISHHYGCLFCIVQLTTSTTDLLLVLFFHYIFSLRVEPVMTSAVVGGGATSYCQSYFRTHYEYLRAKSSKFHVQWEECNLMNIAVIDRGKLHILSLLLSIISMT